MESRPFHYTLLSLVNKPPAEIKFSIFKIAENETIELSYTYIHSKNLVLYQILSESLTKLDLIIFFDLGQNFDFLEFFEIQKVCQIQQKRILVYKIFSFPELFMYLMSIDSFLKDCKKKVIIVIDSLNTYIWNDKPKEKMLDFVLGERIWAILENLKNKYGSINLVCKKSEFQ